MLGHLVCHFLSFCIWVEQVVYRRAGIYLVDRLHFDPWHLHVGISNPSWRSCKFSGFSWVSFPRQCNLRFWSFLYFSLSRDQENSKAGASKDETPVACDTEWLELGPDPLDEVGIIHRGTHRGYCCGPSSCNQHVATHCNK